MIPDDLEVFGGIHGEGRDGAPTVAPRNFRGQDLLITRADPRHGCSLLYLGGERCDGENRRTGEDQSEGLLLPSRSSSVQDV